MTPNHADRAHSTWSASASSRLWACPGSLRLSSSIESPPPGAAARWGTACHELSEHCLKTGFDAIELVNRIEFERKIGHPLDEEMAETAQVYIDYVRDLMKAAEWVKIEQRFSLDTLKPPFDAGGTADAVAYFADLKMLEVVDLKGGRGVVVEVVGNPQLRTYALGALLANPGLDVDKVQVTIVQPRAPHKDGQVRSELFHVADLTEWTMDLMAAMTAAAKPDATLVPGDQCRFCPAAGVCPALAEKAQAEAHVWFDDLGKPNTPDKLMPEDIAKILDNADLIQDWLNAVRAYAHAQAESGVVIPGYHLAEKRATRKWKDDVEKRVREILFLEADLASEEVETRKLKSPAQIEKLIGKDKLPKLLGDYISKESSGTNLVSSSKSSRPAIPPAVEKHFEVLE